MTPEEFWSILHNVPEPKPIYYRVYYRDNGSLICYSQDDLTGNYIDVDPETFMRGLINVRVVNGRLVETHPQLKLKPSNAGTTCDPRDVCVVVDPTHTHIKWSLESNETN